MSTRLKAGICGFGSLGHIHMDSLNRSEAVDVTAVCDIDETQFLAKAVTLNIGYPTDILDFASIHIYSDYHKMLHREKLDLVVVALPTDLHADAVMQALDAGCHVLCEKPMALTIEDCDRMIATRDKNDRELMIGQCLRFWPEYEYLLSCIKDCRFGVLKTLFMERIGSYSNCTESWFNQGKRSGGAMVDLHVHDLDWAQMALGRPSGIYAKGHVGKTGAVDDITSIWDYKDDIYVTIHGSWMYTGRFNMKFTAIFEEASLEYNMREKHGLKIWNSKIDDEEYIELHEANAYLRELQYFMGCARGEYRNLICSAESTRDSIELMTVEKEAIRQNTRIEL
ncbi:MAG: Gfo/Idh/MocA family oxidoreductase [bacterium]|nr:Gfo/Idh/MocA family oxidoreductase [bacterium]